jgi:flagellar biosynthesis/type III secretory pathway M-ring protein FliF/YscJ
MSQKLIFGFPIPVVLAFAVLMLLLFAVAPVLAAMRRAAPVRVPAQQEHGRIDAFDPEDERLFRLGRLEITPLGERGRHLR